MGRNHGIIWRIGPGQPLEPALREAFSGEGPALVDIIADPDGYGDQLASLRG
jgi:hypothetical protein